MNFSSKAKKFGQSPVAAACVSLVIGMTSASALAQSASFGINFPTATATTIELGSGTYGLDADFTTVSGGTSGLPGFIIAAQSVQTEYSSGGPVTLTAGVNLVAGEGGIVNVQNGGGTVTANVSNNSIAASGTGNQLTLASGGSVATIDLGLMSTNKSIGALAVQFLGSQNTTGQVNVQANVSGSTVGALFSQMSAAPISVNSNVVKASATLNDATTLVAGAVPLGFTDSTGGSSSISFAATDTDGVVSVSADNSAATLSINTLQGTVNGGISAGSTGGSYAALTRDIIAIQTQETGGYYDWIDGQYVSPNLDSTLTLNNNTQSAAFTGNNATSVLQADATSNAFSGSASVTNAQANVETLDYNGGAPTAKVSDSQIIADLTYAGVDGSGVSPTALTSSLSVSGTALAPQSISAQSIGNAAGSLNSAGQLTSSGNAVEFRNSTVDLTGTGGTSTEAAVSTSTEAAVSTTGQTARADLIVNSAQVNQSPYSAASGVDSLVQDSGITAAVDRLAANGSVSVNYDAVTAGATGNLAGNLINAQGNNITASMAVVGTQQNTNADVAAQNLGSLVGVGIGDSVGSTDYTVAERADTQAVLGSVTVDNNAIGAVAQGNLAANTLLASAGNTLTSQYNASWGEDDFTGVNPTVVAGLAAVNVQGNTGSAAYANVSGGSVFIAGVDQAGNNAGNLVPLGAATLSASSNRISALAQGNNGGTNIGASAGGAMTLTAAAANSQSNDSTSPVIASLSNSNVLVSGLNSDGTTIATNSNTLTADATGNLGVNAISISGGSTVNGRSGDNTSDLQSLQKNSGGITATASGSGVGVVLGATSLLDEASSWGYTTPRIASEPGLFAPQTTFFSSTMETNPFLLNQRITTVTGAMLDVNASTVATSATGNQVNNTATLSGTTLGNGSAVASVIGSLQDNAGAVESSVTATDVGVRLVNQSNTVSSAPIYNNTVVTSNAYYLGTNTSGSGSFLTADLSTATATAENSLDASDSGSGTSSITAIDTSTASVSDSQVTAASKGNVASNALRLSGTNVELQAGTPLAVRNDQTNQTAAALTASVAGANVGIRVDGEVYGSGTTTLKGSVSATAEPNTLGYVTLHPIGDPASRQLYSGSGEGSTSLFNGSATATITHAPVDDYTAVVGAMTATGINALTATVDNSVLSAASVANSADNRIIVSATNLTAPGSGTAAVNNVQGNGALFDASLATINLGVVLADVRAEQTTEASGSSTAKVVATNNYSDSGSSVVGGLVANTTLSASGSATALGVSGSTTSVQGSALTASAKGNTVTNVVDLGSTASADLGVLINNGNYVPPVYDGSGSMTAAGYYVGGQSNSGDGTATIGGVAMGNIIGGVKSQSSSRVTAGASASGSSNDSGSATAGLVSAGTYTATSTASGSATAVATATGLSASTNTVSGNNLNAATYGNEAVNVVSGSGTAMAALTSLPSAQIQNGQVNTGDLTTTMGATWGSVSGSATLMPDPIQLGVVVGAVSGGGSAIANSTASGSSTATTADTSNASAVAAMQADAEAKAYATYTATGITGLAAGVDGNTLQATNTGNSATNAMRLASTTLGGSTGASTLVNTNAQTNDGTQLSATVDNVGLGVLLTSVDANGSASASASASATAIATANSLNAATASGSSSYTGNSATATADSSATTLASGSATALGISATQASVASNVLRAANTGNSASTLTSLSAASLTGVSGSTTVSGASTQTNSAALTATLGDTGAVTVGVNVGAVTAYFNASAGAPAIATGSGSAAVLGASATSTATPTAYNYVPPVGSGSATSTTGVSGSSTSSASATANATATATGIKDATLSVLSNQLEASNMANSAYTSAVLDGTVLGTSTAPVSVVQGNNQTNSGAGTATAATIMLGIAQGDVGATAGSYASDTSTSGSNTATSNAYAYGIVNSTLSVGGIQAAPQTVTAQSVGNSASTLIAATQTTGSGDSGASGGTTLAVGSMQTNDGSQSALVGQISYGQSPNTVTLGGPVTVGVTVGDVTADASAAVTTPYAPHPSNLYDYYHATANATAVGISGGSTAVQYNTLAAKAFGNSASNSVASTTTTTLAGSAPTVATFTASNTQTNNSTASGDATVGLVDIGVFVGDVSAITSATFIGTTTSTAYAIDAAKINVSNNQSLATSIGNVADNSLAASAAVAGSSTLPFSSLVISGQTNGAAQTALVDAQRVGVFTGTVSASTAYGIKDSALTVGSNQLQAATYGNSATNVNQVTASAVATLDDVVTSNTQTNNVLAIGQSKVSNTTVGVSVDGAQDGALVRTPTTVQANSLAAFSYGNSATNATSVSGGTTLTVTTVDEDVSAFETVNSQTNHADMTSGASAIEVGVMIGTGFYGTSSGNGVDASPLVVKDNAVSAMNYANQASNSLSLTAGNVIDGNEKLARVSSMQTNSSTGSAEATVSAVDVGVIVDANWTHVTDSDVTVDGNRLTAASYLNTASNTLSLAAQTLSAMPATVSNAQTNNATGSGAISAVNVGVFPAGGASDWQDLNNVTSMVGNNALNAQAGGNTASNVLNATASATIAGDSTPTFQVLNAQSNTGVMTASISNAMVGNWGNTGSNYYGGTTMTVSMNSAVANAYGNTASNALSMSALTGASNLASTGLSNSQSNTASLSATVSGVQMGVGSGRGIGTVAVSGNSIAASTVGNAASNRVGIVR